MQVKFSTLLTNPDGTPLKDEGDDVTLGFLCASPRVLDGYLQDERGTLTEVIRRAKLVNKIKAAGKSGEPLEMADSDLDLIKERLGRSLFPPSLILQCVELLTPDESKT